MELSYEAVCFDLFGTLVDGEGRALPGTRDALALLPRERWAIVTSCGRSFAQTILAHAGLPQPALLVSSDDVAQSKPAPDPYRKGAHALGVPPDRAVAVEDSSGGIESARAAGLDVIAILLGRGVDFGRRATYHVERFDGLGWMVEEDGSIRVRIEP